MAPIDESNNDASEDVPEWLTDGDLDSDDAIAWLEEIAAKYDPEFEGSSGESSDSAEPEVEPDEVEEAEEEEVPDWLKAGTPEPVAEAVPEEEPDEEEEEEELPDWLKDEMPEPAAEAVPMAESALEEEPDEEEVPDWLEAETPEPAAEAVPVAESALEEEEEELPDWLKDEIPEPVAEAVPMAKAAPEEEPDEAEGDEDLPDWLKAVTPAPAAKPVEEVEPESAGEEAGAMAWLDEQAEMQGVGAGEVISEALTADSPPATSPDIPPPDAEAEAVSDEELPDWLKGDEVKEAKEKAMVTPTGELNEEIAAAVVTAEDEDIAWLESALEAEEPPDEDLPDWLKAEPAGAVEEPKAGVVEEAEEEEEEGEEDLPDWLQGIEEQPTLSWHISTSEVAAAVAESEREKAEKEEGEDLPDWLKGIGPSPAPADTAPFVEPVEEKEPEEEELPDWITKKPAEEEEEEAIPDWLAEKPAEPAAAVPVTEEEEEEEEVPDWLAEKPAEPAVEAPVAEVEEEPEEEEEEAPPWLAEAPTAPVREEKPTIPEPAAPPVAVPSEIAGDFNEQLRIAREKLSAKAIEEALPYYESLIGSKQMLDQTISDLLYAIKTGEKISPRLRRVLGDAYRCQGQLQEALEAYRQALDEL